LWNPLGMQLLGMPSSWKQILEKYLEGMNWIKLYQDRLDW
jgi:hypothetical protein